MDQLSLLAQVYGTDKWGKHNYTPVYYELFKDRRETVKKVLEIGTAEGAGIYMFRDFFPNATIYGAEIDPKRIDLLRGKDRIVPILCDQTSEDDIFNLVEITDCDVDLVIDDGSHKPEDQLSTCFEIVPGLNKGSIYIIEDVADESIFETIKKRFSYHDCQMVTLSNRYDDRLIIIKKL